MNILGHPRGHEGIGDMWVCGTWECRGLVFWGTCVPDSKNTSCDKRYSKIICKNIKYRYQRHTLIQRISINMMTQQELTFHAIIYGWTKVLENILADSFFYFQQYLKLLSIFCFQIKIIFKIQNHANTKIRVCKVDYFIIPLLLLPKVRSVAQNE